MTFRGVAHDWHCRDETLRHTGGSRRKALAMTMQGDELVRGVWRAVPRARLPERPDRWPAGQPGRHRSRLAGSHRRASGLGPAIRPAADLEGHRPHQRHDPHRRTARSRRLSGKQIAALIGLAPQNHESGKSSRQAKTCNGRSDIRVILFNAARSAIQHNPVMRAFYQRSSNTTSAPERSPSSPSCAKCSSPSTRSPGTSNRGSIMSLDKITVDVDQALP